MISFCLAHILQWITVLVWTRSGFQTIQGQLLVINLAETWASYDTCVAFVWNPDLVHTRTVINYSMWAKQKLIVLAGAEPEKNCYEVLYDHTCMTIAEP